MCHSLRGFTRLLLGVTFSPRFFFMESLSFHWRLSFTLGVKGGLYFRASFICVSHSSPRLIIFVFSHLRVFFSLFFFRAPPISDLIRFASPKFRRLHIPSSTCPLCIPSSYPFFIYFHLRILFISCPIFVVYSFRDLFSCLSLFRPVLASWHPWDFGINLIMHFGCKVSFELRVAACSFTFSPSLGEWRGLWSRGTFGGLIWRFFSFV